MSTTRPNIVKTNKNCFTCAKHFQAHGTNGMGKCNEKRLCHNGSFFVLDEEKQIKEEEYRIESKAW